MKIIEYGTIPDAQYFTHRCERCECRWEFHDRESAILDDGRHVKCPECGLDNVQPA